MFGRGSVPRADVDLSTEASFIHRQKVTSALVDSGFAYLPFLQLGPGSLLLPLGRLALTRNAGYNPLLQEINP